MTASSGHLPLPGCSPRTLRSPYRQLLRTSTQRQQRSGEHSGSITGHDCAVLTPWSARSASRHLTRAAPPRRHRGSEEGRWLHAGEETFVDRRAESADLATLATSRAVATLSQLSPTPTPARASGA